MAIDNTTVNPYFRALGMGCAVFIIGYIGYLTIINLNKSIYSLAKYLPYLMVIIGSAITVRVSASSSNKITYSILAGILMAVSVGIINYIYWLLGFPADLGTARGIHMVSLLVMPFFVILAMAGGFLGSLSLRNKTKKYN